MEPKVITGLVLTLFLVSMLPLAFNVCAARGNKLELLMPSIGIASVILAAVAFKYRKKQ